MSTPLKVLILEDYAPDAELIVYELGRAGFDVDWSRVESEVEFLAALQDVPDLILADFTLPRFDALRALRLINQRGIEAPVIIVTGTISEEVAAACIRHGAADYVLKDSLIRLGQTVRHLLYNRRLQDEKRRAEQELRERELYYRTLVQTIPDAIIVTDLQANIHFCNQQGAALLQYEDPSPVIGRNAFEFLAPEDHERAAVNISHTIRDGQIRYVEYTLLRPDGARLPVEMCGSLISDEAGQPQALMGVIREIGERKQRESDLLALATMAGSLRAAANQSEILNHILDHIVNLMAVEGLALAMRQAGEKRLVVEAARYKWQRCLGQPLPLGQGETAAAIESGRPLALDRTQSQFSREIPEPLQDVAVVVCVPLMADEKPLGVLWVGRADSVSQNEMRLLTAVGEIAGGALHRAMILGTLEQHVARRTEELEQAYEQLQELDHLKSKFIAEVSHELRTPVSNLLLYVGLLEQGRVEKREHYLAVLKKEMERLHQLVEDVTSLARLDQPEVKVEMKPVDLNELVQHVLDVVGAPAQSRGLELRCDIDSDLPPVPGDRSLLFQMVMNLTQNALQYTPSGHISLAARYEAEKQEAILQVADSGVGIDPEDTPRLFERFYRGQAAARLQTPGTGLGLSIVKQIVDQHHGRIQIDSEIGQGVTVTVTLPLP